MRYNFSFSTTDEKLALAIKSFKENGGNLSGLICNLLEHYFFGDNNSKELLTKEMMKLIEIEKRLNEFYKWAEEIMPEIQELKEKLREKQEKQQLQNELPLIRELRNIVFDDLDPDGPKARISSLLKSLRLGYEEEVRRAIKARLSAWAAEKQLSMPKAISLFCKAFPELRHLFEVVEVVR